MRMNLKDTSFLGLPASPPLFSPLLSVQDTSSSYQVSSSPVLCSPRPLSPSRGRRGARGLLRPLLLAPKRGQFIHRRQNTFRLTRQRARREGGKGAASRALISSSHNHGTVPDYNESRELHPCCRTMSTFYLTRAKVAELNINSKSW